MPWETRPVSSSSRSPPACQNGRQHHHLPRQPEPRRPSGLRLPARTGTLRASSPARALAALRRVELCDQDVQPGHRALLPALRPQNARTGHHQVRCPPGQTCCSGRMPGRGAVPLRGLLFKIVVSSDEQYCTMHHTLNVWYDRSIFSIL